jgi:hypothetical protein
MGIEAGGLATLVVFVVGVNGTIGIGVGGGLTTLLLRTTQTIIPITTNMRMAINITGRMLSSTDSSIVSS